MTRHFALLAMLAAALLPSAARAQDANADGQASARIVKPLSLANYADLDFGTVVITGLGAGTVTIDPNAVPGADVSYSGGIVAVSDAHAALFGGAAVKQTVVNIRIPKSPILLTRAGGTETLQVRDFTLQGQSKRTLAALAAFDFRVGASIDIPANAAEGLYEGEFEITVQYP